MAKKMVAVLVALCVLLSVGASLADKEAPVSLRFILRGSAGSRNVEFFENEFHERMLQDLNLDITIDYVPFSGDDKLATMMASGEKFAFMNTLSRNPSHASSGFLATFDEEMIREVAPAYIKARGDYGFNCVRYQGNIVTIPSGNRTFGGMQDNLAVRNDILNAVGWDYTMIHSYEDLMAACAAVKAAYPDMYIISQIHTLTKALCDVYAPDSFYDSSINDVFVVDDKDLDSDEIISFFESEDFLKLVKIYREWYDLGYIKPEHVTGSPTNPTSEWGNGNALLDIGGPGYLYNHEMTQVPGADVRLLIIGDTKISVIKNDYDWGFAVSIADQDRVNEYLKFFNWIYESEENYDFALYGVEGKDFVFREDGTIERITTENFFPTYLFATTEFDRTLKNADPEEVKQYLEFDENCRYSKLSGFGFDDSNVSIEKAQVTAIINERVKPLVYGMGDFDTEWPEVLEELKEAGLDAYHEEYQRQFSEFWQYKVK